MPPEEAEGLVFLDAFFADGSLHVKGVRIDQVEDHGQPSLLEVIFYEKPSAGYRPEYWTLGNDVAFARRREGYREPEAIDEIEMPVRGKGYMWPDSSEAIILVLPRGYTAISEGSSPQAKVADGRRIALLWNPGPIFFGIAELKGAPIQEVGRINAKYGPQAQSKRQSERTYLGETGQTVRSFMAFWTTLPGLLTGVAGILTAVALLTTALVSTGVCSGIHFGDGSTQGGQPILHVDPQHVLDFGTHTGTEFPITRAVTVTNYGDGTLRLDTQPELTGDGFTLSSSSSCYFAIHTLAHGDSCDFNITFFPPASSGPGQFTGRLTITDTFDHLQQSVDLRVISR